MNMLSVIVQLLTVASLGAETAEQARLGELAANALAEILFLPRNRTSTTHAWLLVGSTGGAETLDGGSSTKLLLGDLAVITRTQRVLACGVVVSTAIEGRLELGIHPDGNLGGILATVDVVAAVEGGI